MAGQSEQVRHTMCSPGACGPPGNWELTAQSLQAGGSALGGRLPPSRHPSVQNHCACLANSKPEAMHTRTKRSTDKDNWGGGAVCLPARLPCPTSALTRPAPAFTLLILTLVIPSPGCPWTSADCEPQVQTLASLEASRDTLKPSSRAPIMVPIGISGPKDIRSQKHPV